MRPPRRQGLHKTADVVRRELDALLARADELYALQEKGSHARQQVGAYELRQIERMLSLAHCELIPRDDPRRRAAERVAADLRRAA